MSHKTNMELQGLFGHNMTVMLPVNAKDASDMREVPDNQEVFVHPDTDQSLIFEILEYVQEPDQDALKTHFEDLAESNDASGKSHVESVETIPSHQLSHSQCHATYLLTGQQEVAKFKESVRNVINVHMALFRLPKLETDILLTLNNPVHISPQSSSITTPADAGSSAWTLENFKECFSSVKLINEDFLV